MPPKKLNSARALEGIAEATIKKNKKDVADSTRGIDHINSIYWSDPAIQHNSTKNLLSHLEQIKHDAQRNIAFLESVSKDLNGLLPRNPKRTNQGGQL